MKIIFYVNGMPVDTYTYTGSQMSAEDEQAIDKIKRDAYRNFGYPVVAVYAPDGDV